MKLAGIILASICTVGIGLYKAVYLKKEMELMDNLLDLMKYIKSNIEYYNMPLIDIYKSYIPKKASFGDTVDEIANDGWAKTLEKNKYSYLSPQTKKLIADYGNALGCTYKEGQLQHNGYYIGEMTKMLDEAKVYTPQRMKVYISLGVYAGLLMIILFI